MFHFNLLLLIFILSGCTGNRRCDPVLDTDSLSTWVCTLNGGFEEYVSKTQDILDDAKLENDALSNQKKNVVVEGTQKKRKLSQAEQEFSQLESDINALDKKLTDSKIDNAKLKRQIADIKHTIKTLKLSKTGSEEERQKLEYLIKQKNDLQKALDYLSQ